MTSTSRYFSFCMDNYIVSFTLPVKRHRFGSSVG